MNILSPVKSCAEVVPVIKAGADEIYCGVLSKEWKRKYTHAGTINGSPYSDSNFASYDELRSCVETAHTYNVPVFFTINSYYYIKQQYSLLLSEIERSIKYGVDALIVSDIGLLLELKKKYSNIDMHMSVTTGIFNSKAIQFYKEFGIKRIILPKQLSISDMREITKSNKGVEFECFILTGLCANEEAFCRFDHGLIEFKHPLISKLLFSMKNQYGLIRSSHNNKIGKIISGFMENTVLKDRSGCFLDYDVYTKEYDTNKSNCLISNKKKNHKKIERYINNHFSLNRILYGCGACAIYHFERFGIKSIKTEGRRKPLNEKVKDVIFLKKLNNFLKNKPNKEKLERFARDEFSNIFNYNCNPKKCYYSYIKM